MDNNEEFGFNNAEDTTESESQESARENKFTYISKSEVKNPDMHGRNIPKWQPWENRNDASHYSYIPNKKSWVLSIAAVLLALIIAVIAICMCINIVATTNSRKGSSEAATLSLSNHKGVTKLNLTDTSEILSHEDLTSKGYMLIDVSGIVEEVLPSVVSVTSRALVNYYNNYYGGYDDLWDFFFGSRGGIGFRNEVPSYREEPADAIEPKEIDSGIGSGTIIAQNSSELLILTSYHVVENSSSLYVTFTNETSVDGYIKSADADNDIAIVAVPLNDIDNKTLNSIKIATISPERAKVGEGVIVIGNALGYGISVTTGIISATDRAITVDGKDLSVIQTDAAINSGNSGGCMLNSAGEVIGINEAKVTRNYVEGMCYAIPVSSNLGLIQNLLNKENDYDSMMAEEETAEATGVYLGIRGRDVDTSIQQIYGDLPQGVYVSSTVPGSGAQYAGIVAGDIIVGIDDAVISTMEELQNELKHHNPGDSIIIVLLRDRGNGYQSMTLEVILTDWLS